MCGLIQEKPFKTITVQRILDRAHIGRSTFYVHYRDKDDLFLSDLLRESLHVAQRRPGVRKVGLARFKLLRQGGDVAPTRRRRRRRSR